jgi:hypothetical protein
MDPMENDYPVDNTPWPGHEGRECGEHHPGLNRGWCFDCTEWCYDISPCKGCEIPMLRARVEELEALLREALND